MAPMPIAPLEKMSLNTSRRLLVDVVEVLGEEGNWNAVALEASNDSAATAAIWKGGTMVLVFLFWFCGLMRNRRVASAEIVERQRKARKLYSSKSRSDRTGRYLWKEGRRNSNVGTILQLCHI